MIRLTHAGSTFLALWAASLVIGVIGVVVEHVILVWPRKEPAGS